MFDKHFVGLDLTGVEDNGLQRPISRVTLLLDNENSITAGDDTGLELPPCHSGDGQRYPCPDKGVQIPDVQRGQCRQVLSSGLEGVALRVRLRAYGSCQSLLANKIPAPCREGAGKVQGCI